MKTVFETDDLWDVQQIKDHLVPLKEKFPNLIVNAFAIPNKLGPVHQLKAQYPWIKFCIHGFEHTHYECAEWTEAKAAYLMGVAMEMGYEPVFKAPNYYMDEETAAACLKQDMILVLAPGNPSEAEGGVVFPTKHSKDHVRITSHIVRYPGSQDFIEDHPWFAQAKPEDHDFASIAEVV